MIFKVQLSLQTTAARRQVLIYNEDRSLTVSRDATTSDLAFMGARFKAFADGDITDAGGVRLNRIVPDEDW